MNTWAASFTQSVDDTHGQLDTEEHESPSCSPETPGLHAVMLVLFSKHFLLREQGQEQKMWRYVKLKKKKAVAMTLINHHHLCRKLLQVQDLQSVSWPGLKRHQLLPSLRGHNTDLKKKDEIRVKINSSNVQSSSAGSCNTAELWCRQSCSFSPHNILKSYC